MSDEVQGFALPLKWPELPACGLSPNAAPAVIPESANALARVIAATFRRILLIALFSSFVGPAQGYTATAGRDGSPLPIADGLRSHWSGCIPLHPVRVADFPLLQFRGATTAIPMVPRGVTQVDGLMALTHLRSLCDFQSQVFKRFAPMAVFCEKGFLHSELCGGG